MKVQVITQQETFMMGCNELHTEFNPTKVVVVADDYTAIDKYNKVIDDVLEANGGHAESLMHGAVNITKITHGASYTIVTMMQQVVE
jgi:ATP-dependent Clp protease adapter protein ClpS